MQTRSWSTSKKEFLLASPNGPLIFKQEAEKKKKEREKYIELYTQRKVYTELNPHWDSTKLTRNLTTRY